MSAAATPQPSVAVVLSSDNEHEEPLLHHLLLLAATTWLWDRCDRHTSRPASFVMDITFRRSDGSHVSVDTVHSISASVFLFLFSQVVPSPEPFFRRSRRLHTCIIVAVL